MVSALADLRPAVRHLSMILGPERMVRHTARQLVRGMGSSFNGAAFRPRVSGVRTGVARETHRRASWAPREASPPGGENRTDSLGCGRTHEARILWIRASCHFSSGDRI